MLEFMIYLRKEYIYSQRLKGEKWCNAHPIAEELARAERDIKSYEEELARLKASDFKPFSEID